MEVTLTTDPITAQELDTMIASTNEVRYCRKEEEANTWAQSLLEREERVGRFETTTRVQKIGRQWVVFVTRNGR